MKVLSTDDGKYNVIDDCYPNQSYSIYVILTPQEVSELRDSYYNPPKSDFNWIDYFTDQLVNKGIINSTTMARNVAKAIWLHSQSSWDCLAGTNENLLILQGADETIFVTARVAR
ncbi:hypothetical protein DMR38_09515 [Clostridium sp. AWRP]|nr:hypothetical protein DMR38_09515 [Clostridium sp. AWRP]